MIEKKEDLLEKEFYFIEEEDGKKYVHIEEYLWDAREAGKTVDIDGEEVDADIVVVEYTKVYIPLEEFVSAENRWDLINEYEGACQQYEMEYTWEQFEKEFPPNRSKNLIDAGSCYYAEHLEYDDITMSTPTGWYWWTV